MLHTCAVRFDVTGNLEKFCELNKALVSAFHRPRGERGLTCGGLSFIVLTCNANVEEHICHVLGCHVRQTQLAC